MALKGGSEAHPWLPRFLRGRPAINDAPNDRLGDLVRGQVCVRGGPRRNVIRPLGMHPGRLRRPYRRRSRLRDAGPTLPIGARVFARRQPQVELHLRHAREASALVERGDESNRCHWSHAGTLLSLGHVGSSAAIAASSLSASAIWVVSWSIASSCRDSGRHLAQHACIPFVRLHSSSAHPQ